MLRGRGTDDGGNTRLLNDLAPSDLPLAVGLGDDLVADAVHGTKVRGAQRLLPAAGLCRRPLERLALGKLAQSRLVRRSLPSATPIRAQTLMDLSRCPAVRLPLLDVVHLCVG